MLPSLRVWQGTATSPILRPPAKLLATLRQGQWKILAINVLYYFTTASLHQGFAIRPILGWLAILLATQRLGELQSLAMSFLLFFEKNNLMPRLCNPPNFRLNRNLASHAKTGPVAEPGHKFVLQFYNNKLMPRICNQPDFGPPAIFLARQRLRRLQSLGVSLLLYFTTKSLRQGSATPNGNSKLGFIQSPPPRFV